MTAPESNTANLNSAESMFSWPELLTELTFAALPIVVLLIVLATRHQLRHLFLTADISLAMAVILGQAIARFIFVSIKSQRSGTVKVKPAMAMLIVAFVLVFALSPMLILIALVVSSDAESEIREILLWPQILTASWGLFWYMAMGAIAMQVKGK